MQHIIWKIVPPDILLNDRKLLRVNFHPKWRQNFPKILSKANPWWKFIPDSIEKAFQLLQFEHSYFLIVVFLLTLSIWKAFNQGSVDGKMASSFVEPYLWRTLSEFILIWTMIGARCVFIIWFGWLIVSASITTSWSPRASSKILSTSLWTSTK